MVEVGCRAPELYQEGEETLNNVLDHLKDQTRAEYLNWRKIDLGIRFSLWWTFEGQQGKKLWHEWMALIQRI
jgi:hypothetical protein